MSLSWRKNLQRSGFVNCCITILKQACSLGLLGLGLALGLAITQGVFAVTDTVRLALNTGCGVPIALRGFT